MATSLKNNFLPPALVSNLQEVLLNRKGGGDADKEEDKLDQSAEPSSSTSTDAAGCNSDNNCSKPVVLITNGNGIESPGLTCLVEALVREGLYNIHVCAPQSDKSVSGHSVTLRETVAVTAAEINGATAYEVSGTPVDCVSLALSGALFSWTKPLLVISGIDRGSNCGNHMLYSGLVAGAREAMICGVPSISISLNWKKDQSQESDFKDAVTVCLPIVNAAIRDIEKRTFPKNCSLNIEIPSSPLTNQGLKLTKQSLRKPGLLWQAVSANRHPAGGHFMSNQQSVGIQLAQLSRDASAAGAARRLTTQKKNLEIDSVGIAGKSDFNRVKKYFRLEFVNEEQEEDTDEDLDYRALENGYITVTPLLVSPHLELEERTAVSDWISALCRDR